MELDTDIETARQVLDEAFHKLALRRLEQARNRCAVEFEREQTPERLEAYRAADQAYARARARGVDVRPA